ncbi:MAG: hypothetical protein AAGA30_03475 [Planctomycetota bacterium]
MATIQPELKRQMSNISRFLFATALIMLGCQPLAADVFNDSVDIVIDDVSAGVGGVASIAQVDVTAVDLELEHFGAGGFDVDLNPAFGCDFFLTITHFAPFDGAPIGSFDWKIGDTELRDAEGSLRPGKITGIELPPGGFNAMPTTATTHSATALIVSTGPFVSSSTGALNDYLVRVAMDGDINKDCQVDLLDVAPFVEILATGGYQHEADTNNDGLVDLLDIDNFVEILTGS